ncbi:hypothetical protein LEP1GSC088_3593 [Leptospira interrogans str. L1207]|nr:hypothetical protein LEP1GSC088_3593 [Leptospira interrogans str. L1207]
MTLKSRGGVFCRSKEKKFLPRSSFKKVLIYRFLIIVSIVSVHLIC